MAAIKSGDVRICPIGRALSTGCTAHSARVARSVLGLSGSDRLISLLRVREGSQDASDNRGGRNTKGTLPVQVEDTNTDGDGSQKRLGERLDGAITEAGPE